MILVKKTLPLIILLGTISFVLSALFGFNTLTEWIQTENGVSMLKFDVLNYLKNLNNAINTTPPPFETLIPWRVWKSIDGGDWFEDLVNNLALLFDWIYFPVNLLLYAVRWFAYIWQIGFTIIGWPMTKTNGVYDSIVMQIINWLSQNLIIPYI